MFPTTGTLSSFSGADENPISEDGAWTNDPFAMSAPAMQRISGAISGSVTAGLDCEAGFGTVFGADQEVRVAMPTLGIVNGWVWLGVRGDFVGRNGYYGVWINGATQTQRIYRRDNGVDTQLGVTNTAVFTAGDEFGFEAIGSTLTMYRKIAGAWSAMFSRSDATYAGGGKLFISADNTTVRMDDFAGGGTPPELPFAPRRQPLGV